ncbi:Prostaglandin F synthase-like [Oopsacas minuta]|uniref:Prostaglandin F synthase-like n=1 Tax=Oopsacas minuta TaxID=111878 RepID=A0AAV7KI10_9METZ|nr:Prostaglandin F synthase-like [Oopsacas minuta]
MAENSLSTLNINSTIKLNDSVEIPCIGFGTYLNTGDKALHTVTWAIQAGYRLIDTAALYKNEAEIGRAIKKFGIPRDQLFIITKLWDSDHGRKAATQAFMNSLHKLDLGYIDMYLIHSPNCGKIVDTWRALIELKAKGLVRSIGVSNFGVHHLKALQSSFPNDLPSVNQLEITPYLTRSDLVSYCRHQGIGIMAYSPLTQGHMLKDPPLTELALKYNKSTAQLLIRWSIQSGFIVIPKSSKQERIKENINLFDFEISADDMLKLNALDRHAVFDWDPTEEPWTS